VIKQGVSKGRVAAGLGAVLAAAIVALLAPAAGSAATWAPVASNTTEDISAIEYQGPDRFWFTTANGKIFKRLGGDFQQKLSVPGQLFTDIEFQDTGQIGFAVGANGAVYRSANAGDTWAQVAGIAGGRSSPNESTRCDLADQPLGDPRSINFSGDARAWLTASGTQIYRTVNGATADNVGSNAAGWQYINDNGATCKIPGEMDDTFPIPGSGSVYFIGRSFGEVFFTSNNLDSAAATRPADAGNGFTTLRRVAGDPNNPNRQWAVTSGGGGGSYLARTADGWATAQAFTLGGPAVDWTNMFDIDFAGGTVVTVGSAGLLANSTDGNTFWTDTAPGALATQEWISVGVASATAAAAGGRSGALVLTDTANVLNVPDTTAPETTITKKPKKKVKTKKKKVKVTFEFTSSEPGSTFVCGLDNNLPTACTSPFTAKVKKGTHAFAVTATDPAGNPDPTPAAYSFKVKRKKKKRH
jgi:photosystem II stability/assembly factor-like uncharacterized protein